METIRVLLANSHPLIRNSLRLLLEREQDFLIVGEASNGREAVVLADYRHPNVVLLDIPLPYVDGLAAAREISSKNKGTGVVFVTTNPDLEYASEAFKAGAGAYVLADSAQVELVRAIRAVVRGRSFLSPTIASQLIEDYQRTHAGNEKRLSVRDRQLVRLLVEGYDEREIALDLNSSVETIKSDCQNIKRLLLKAGMPGLTQHEISQAT